MPLGCVPGRRRKTGPKAGGLIPAGPLSQGSGGGCWSSFHFSADKGAQARLWLNRTAVPISVGFFRKEAIRNPIRQLGVKD